MLAQIALTDDVRDFTEGSFAVDANYDVGKPSISQQPPGTFCTGVNDASKQVDEEDLLGANTVVAAFESFCIDDSSMLKDEEEKEIMTVDVAVKSSVLGYDGRKDAFKGNDVIKSSTLKDDGGKVATKADDACESRYPDVESSSPWRRRSHKGKSDQDNKTKRPARNCRKAAKKKVLLDFSSLQLTRRRRSSLCKRARSTVWGLLGNIAQVVEQNGRLDVGPDKAKRSRRPRGIQSSRKREKNLNIRSSEKFKGKTHIPTGPISLKVKFGKETASVMNVTTSIDQKIEKGSIAENSFHTPLKDVQDLLTEEVPGSMRLRLCDGSSKKASGMHLSDKGIIGCQDRSTSDDCDDFPFHAEVEKVGATIDNRILDSGTSPDSEVINTVPDAQIGGKDSEELLPDLISSHGYTASDIVSSLSPPWKSNDQGRRKDELHETGGCSQKGEISSPGNLNILKEEKLGQRENMGDGSYSSDASTSTTTGNASIDKSNMEGFYGEHLPPSRAADIGISKVESQTESNLSPKLGIQLECPESLISGKLLPVAKGQKLTITSRAKKVNKSKSETPNSSTTRERTSKKKGNQGKSAGKSTNKEKEDNEQILHEVENHHETGNSALFGDIKDVETDKGNVKGDNINIVTSKVAGDCITSVPPGNAWVSCDVCHKWRRIPANLADKIEETNCRWVCKDNMDREFADCSIPQEKSNADINAELEISDASCEEDARDVCLNSNKSRRKQSTVNEQSPWTLIKSNLFLNRRRKNQTIDEIMVCGCKPPVAGRTGCRGKCLNRMLNIECIPGTCPCGEFCSNQQFQKRKYAKLKSIRCGKKGYGLQLLEDVSEGQFLIEYVGEVLDMHAYEARQRDYALKGHKHFYFMTLNGCEVIDACAKGNLGRFINHSCDPNCRTEKWIVNGEVCIGIFALRDIKKGQEVTFDYNYVRVFGAAAKKCVCGSSQCRGYIGGDPLNSEVIVQGDSDEEYPEPVMVHGDVEMDQNLKNNMLRAKSSLSDREVRNVEGHLKIIDETDESLSTSGQAEISSGKQTRDVIFKEKLQIDSSSTVAGCSEITKESRVSMNMSACTAPEVGISVENDISVGQHSPVLHVETSLQSGDVTSGNICSAPEEFSATEKYMNDSLCSDQGLDTDTVSLDIDRSLPVISGSKKKLKRGTKENKVILSKSHPRTKISGRVSSVKTKNHKTDAVTAKKPLETDSKSHEVPIRPKKLLEDQSNFHFEAGRYEAVQEKLNELLDSDGGISKRKDASRGYLKLLLLTAASGDSGNGEAIQSNRDLSMILDALLKTKSRTVLVDIINKNGLQMLHNIMKRYRKEFIKIPILRKLLKVLEYLATREILTTEHINGGPRCPGVESFRDSILTLTEHNDKQVHQIARNFRDRWIPRCFRKFGSMDWDDCRAEFHRGPNHDRFSASHNSSTDRAAKPSEIVDCDVKSASTLSAVDAPMLEGSSASRGKRKRKSRWDQPCKETPDLGPEIDMAGGGANNIDEDVPPGFSSPLKGSVLPSDASSSAINHWKQRTCHPKYPYGVAVGHPQQRFISRTSVAYGVPFPIVEQFGTQQSGASETWIVAPGMPFQPFPPLPPYPRVQSRCTTSQTGQDCHARGTFDSSQNTPTASGVAGPDSETSGAINQLDFQRPRGYNNMGRKYFRQQKINNSMLAPPWVRMRNGWGPLGNNSRNGMCQPDLGNGPNEFKSRYNAQDYSTGVQNGNTFHQHP